MKKDSFKCALLPPRLCLVAVALAVELAIVDLSAATLYVAERVNGNVVAVETITGESRVAASGLGSMIGATVDRRGRLFVYRFDAQTVAVVDLVDNSFVDIATGINGHGLWAAPDSDTLYLAGYGDQLVYRITEQQPDSWSVDVVASGLPAPIGVYQHGQVLYVADRSGRLYAQHLDDGTLEEIVALPAGGEIISREAGGDLIIGTIQGPVCRVSLTERRVVRTYAGFANPAGVIVDPADNSVLVNEHDGHRITRLNLVTGQKSLLTSFVDTPYQATFAKEVRLTIELFSNDVRLSWPLDAGDWALEVSGAPGLPYGWSPIPPPYESDTDGWLFTAPAISRQQFFRLRKP